MAGHTQCRVRLHLPVKKSLAIASHEKALAWPRSSAVTRRQMLRLSAAVAVAVASFDRSAQAKKPGPSSIAIIGGGVAELTAAYRLQ